jgi:hypothetical protein
MLRCTGFIKPATHTDEETARCPESLCPLPVLPPAGRRVPPPERTLLLRHRSYGLMRQSRWLSPPSVFHLVPGVCAGCLPAPAANGIFPTLFCKSFPRCLVPYHDGPTECFYLFLPRCHRPSPRHYRSASRFDPRTRLSRGLVFRGCRHFVMFRPLSLLASQIAPTAASFPTGQPRLLRPGISCFVTSARSGYAIRPIQVIDGERTFTFPDLQPCRLLQCLTNRTVSPFPVPASSNPAGGFPALGLPACFSSRLCGCFKLEGQQKWKMTQKN